MNNMFTHQIPTNMDDAFAEEEDAYLATCLSMIELMLIQMQTALTDHPDIVSISFALDDGDPDSMPMFDFSDKEGFDFSDELYDLAQQWNDSNHAGVRHFLCHAENQTLHQDSLVSDRTALINHLAQSLPFPDEKQQKWANSFSSFMKARDLQKIAASGFSPSPAKPKKPGM